MGFTAYGCGFGSDEYGEDLRRRETCNVDRHSSRLEGEVKLSSSFPERFSRTPRLKARGRILLPVACHLRRLDPVLRQYMPKPTMALLDIEKSVAGSIRQGAISRMSLVCFCQRIRRLRREEDISLRGRLRRCFRKLGFWAMKSDVSGGDSGIVSARKFRSAAADADEIAGREVCIVISLCICRRFVCSFARLLVFVLNGRDAGIRQ